MSVEPKNGDSAFAQYLDELPSPQTAVNAVPGWVSMFPPNVNVTAGGMPLFQDERIVWVLQQFGPVDGRRVLELGPLEGGHTYMLDAAGALVDAIEANKPAFLRCLVAKEIVGTRNAHFFLGNFIKWLQKDTGKYDLIVASGVLYHMSDPLDFLRLVAARCNALYLWTHYFSDELLPPGDGRRALFAPHPEIVYFDDIRVRLYQRTYAGTQTTTSFCGGMFDQHRWIDRSDLLRVLTALGFADLTIAHDEPSHQNGPAFSLFARRAE